MARYVTITLRRDSALNWYVNNPKLALGEAGIDMTNFRFKVGNGIDNWNELPYMNDDLYKTLDKELQKVADKIEDAFSQIRNNKASADRAFESLSLQLQSVRIDVNKAVQDVHEGLEEFNVTRDQLTTRMDAIAGQATEDTEILDARVDAEYITHPNLGHNIRAIHEKLLSTAEHVDKSSQEIAGIQEFTKELESNDSGLQSQVDELSEGVAENTLSLDYEIEQRRKAISQDRARISNLESENASRKAEIIAESAERAEQDDLLQEFILLESQERSEQDSEISKIIEDEAREREASDFGLAEQADNNARANAENTLLIHELNEKRKEDLTREVLSRLETESALQEQVNKNSEGVAENTLAIHNEAEARRKADNAERAAREADKAALLDIIANESIDREQADNELENQIADEARKRREDFAELNERIDINEQQINLLDNALDSERAQRVEQDIQLVQSINAEKQERISENLQLESALNDEIQERSGSNEGLAKQVNDNAEANARNTLLLDKFNKARIADLNCEVIARAEQGTELQQQIDKLAEAENQNTFNLHDEAEQRRQGLDYEASERIASDKLLQEQTDLNSEAILNNVLNLYQEAQERRKLADKLIQEIHDREREIQNLFNEIAMLYEIPLPGLRDQLTALQQQADFNAEANARNSLAIHDEAMQRREAIATTQNNLEQEINTRYSNDTGILSQLGNISSGMLELVSAVANANSQRRIVDNLERNEKDELCSVLQAQVDKLAGALLDAQLNNAELQTRVRKIEEHESKEGTNFDEDVFNDVIEDVFNS